jgi:hypothetical protein
MLSIYLFILYSPIIYSFVRFFIRLYQKDKNAKKVSSEYFYSYIIGILILFLFCLIPLGAIGNNLTLYTDEVLQTTGEALLIGSYLLSITTIRLVFIVFSILCIVTLKKLFIRE